CEDRGSSIAWLERAGVVEVNERAPFEAIPVALVHLLEERLPLRFVKEIGSFLGRIQIWLLLPERAEIWLPPRPRIVEERNFHRIVDARERFAQRRELAIRDVGAVRVQKQKLEPGVFRVEELTPPKPGLGGGIGGTLAGLHSEERVRPIHAQSVR